MIKPNYAPSRTCHCDSRKSDFNRDFDGKKKSRENSKSNPRKKYFQSTYIIIMTLNYFLIYIIKKGIVNYFIVVKNASTLF